jgi:hypothetical protein
MPSAMLASATLAGVLLVGVISASALLAGCRRPAEAQPPRGQGRPTEAAQPAGGQFLQLRQGALVPLEGSTTGAEPQTLPAPSLPWTVQERVASLTSLAGRAYLGVNGYGIAAVSLEAGGLAGFRSFYDRSRFRFRTLTALIPEEGSLLCHLYFNELLSTAVTARPSGEPVSLLELDQARGSFQLRTPPFQREHQEWEAVGFVAETPRRFYLEWKHTEAGRVQFARTVFSTQDGEEREVDALSYRRSYHFLDLEREGTPALRTLFAQARALLDEPGVCSAYQLTVQRAEEPLPRRYEYHPADFATAARVRLHALAVWQSGPRYLLLTPAGELLEATDEPAGKTPSALPAFRRHRLPPAPGGGRYGELLLLGDTLLATWEQDSFTEVGAAGIFLCEFR